VKIIDFGFSVAIPIGQKLKIFCGTPSYIAPEIILGHPYGLAGDIWAMGILLYVFLAGRFPFKSSTNRELYRRIVRHSYPTLDFVNADAMDLINRTLQKDQTTRPTLEEMLACPWLSNDFSTSVSSSGGEDVAGSYSTAASGSLLGARPSSKAI